MYNIIQLNDKDLSELQSIAKELGIKKTDSLKKEDLVYKILDEQAIVGATQKVAAEKANESQPRKRSRINVKKDGDKVYTATKDKAQKLEANTPQPAAAAAETVKETAPVAVTPQTEAVAETSAEEKTPKKRGKFAKLLLKGSEKIALSQADKVIFVNKFQMQKSPKKYNTKYIYIPNGIPKVSFPKNVNFIQSLKLESKKYILAVGRITPEKGFDLLIKAFSQINTDYKLVIAGGVETETGYFKKLQDMIPPLRIIFTGYATGDNLKQLYSNAALFVLPSRNEGFPIVLLEAMAYQLDVLVSDIPATHLVDLQEKDYFKLDDENSLIKGISDKLQNITSRKYDLTNFNWDKIALKVYDIYHNI